MRTRQKGIVLPLVIIVIIIFVLTGLAVLTLAEQEAILGKIEANKTRAFYLAEAGLAKMREQLQKPLANEASCIFEETLEPGRYSVALDTNQSPCYVISTGVSENVHKKIRVQANFLAAPFENAVYAMNKAGGSWAFQLRGIGNPVLSSGREKGGRDIINGNIFVDGDTVLYEESSVNPAPAPNIWNLNGDVGATGGISVVGSAQISGETNPNSEEPDLVDVTVMDYANNNTHNVAKIFQDAGISTGYLPVGNSLRDVFVKNPSDRAAECGTTAGNDYFLEPSSGFILGTEKTGSTPIHVGSDRVYYVDGDVWVHSKATYGFLMDGKVTIVATGNIHISDNIQYADQGSLLGLVALGKYDSSNTLVSGGNIFFGDPRYGTMYVISGLMFAANDFLYNSDTVTRNPAEPTTGFTVNGGFAAMGKVMVERDWYTKVVSGVITARPAKYNSATGQWVDSLTGVVLSSTEIGTIRHYQMIVNYDERVRNPETQPPGLPRGGARIFAGFSNWEEL